MLINFLKCFLVQFESIFINVDKCFNFLNKICILARYVMLSYKFFEIIEYCC